MGSRNQRDVQVPHYDLVMVHDPMVRIGDEDVLLADYAGEILYGVMQEFLARGYLWDDAYNRGAVVAYRLMRERLPADSPWMRQNAGWARENASLLRD